MKFNNIILVDDDIATLESFKDILEHEGFTTLIAKNEFELKTLLSKYVPNLIIMDYNLGENNGGMITKNLKKSSRTSHIPVIIISANVKLRAPAMSLGANDFIAKPIEISLLLSKIKKHIMNG